MTTTKKRIMIDLEKDQHSRLTKIARRHAARLKPYIELILSKYDETPKE